MFCLRREFGQRPMRGLLFLFVMCAAVACTDSTAPVDTPDTRWALALANRTVPDQSIRVSSTISSYTSDTSPDAGINVTRAATGTYSVLFTRLAARTGWKQSVAVSAVGSDPRRCRVVSTENQGENLVVEVRCHDFAGALADSYFNILVATPGLLTGRAAFAISSLSPGDSVPSATAYNSSGKKITVARMPDTQTGLYTVTFEGLSRGTGTTTDKEIFHVTAYGDGSHWCKVVGWGVSEQNVTNLELYVGCFTAAGDPVDGQFSVLMLNRERAGGRRLGFVWAHNPSAAASTPHPNWNYNSTNAVNTAERSAVGVYTISWVGLQRGPTSTAETSLVTAFGQDPSYCQVETSLPSATKFRCFATNGALVNARFLAIWIE